MKLKEVFEKSIQFFKDKKIESARLDVELLLAHVLKTERLQIYLKFEQPLTETEVQACREAIWRRSRGEPVAYIVGEKGFYRELFKVGPGVLIPRPETEMLVEEALEFIEKNKIENPQILDLGAGTGCIGFSILKNCKTAKLTSVEKSEKAFSYLKQNQEALQLQDRSTLVLSDVMNFKIEPEVYDIVVANPPYIAIDDTATEIHVKKFEPSEALFAENNGLKDLFDWSQLAVAGLKKPGLILFEMGYQQGAQLKPYFEKLSTFSEVKILKDLSGLDRAVKATHNITANS
ncbi:MAG: peptide chain release factor N(5)-glutamine methyltransferase [Pseudobdellovibrio sp.]